MLVSGNDILELIPQRPPVVMIGTLLHADREKTITGFSVGNSCIFTENGMLSESGLLENIAQTAAAGVGYICKQEQRDVPIGFIAAMKDVSVYELPAAGSNLKTEVILVNEVMDVSIVKGKVTAGDKLLAECEMRIFLTKENPQ